MKRILIVDSSVERCLALSDLLGDVGFETGVADNGLRAMYMLSKANPLPDFILLDVRIKSSNNWGLKEMLEKHVRYGNIPVILMGDEGVGEEVELNVTPISFSTTIERLLACAAQAKSCASCVCAKGVCTNGVCVSAA